MMRRDEVQDLSAQRVGKSGDGATRVVHHDRAKRDVTDQVPLASVGRRRVVVQLLQLADVVQDRTGHDQVCAGAVQSREHAAGLGHGKDVLEESAAIRVVDDAGGRPALQRDLVFRNDPCQQCLQMGVLHGRNDLLELPPHLVDGTWRRRHEGVFSEAVAAVLRVGARHHWTDGLDQKLQPSVVEVGATLHLHELAGLELLAQPVDVVEHTRDDLAGGVGQRQRQVVTATSGPHRFVRAQEETPADGVGGEF